MLIQTKPYFDKKIKNLAWLVIIVVLIIITYEAIKFSHIKKTEMKLITKFESCMHAHKIIIQIWMLRCLLQGLVLYFIGHSEVGKKEMYIFDRQTRVQRVLYISKILFDHIKIPLAYVIVDNNFHSDISFNYKSYLWSTAEFFMTHLFCTIFRMHMVSPYILLKIAVALYTKLYKLYVGEEYRISSDIIPRNITKLLKKEILVYKLQEHKILSYCICIGSKVRIFLGRDVGILFTEEELVSILYHEAGHAYNNASLWQIAYYLTQFIFMFVIIYVCLRSSEKRIGEEDNENTYNRNSRYIKIIIILHIIVDPLARLIINYLKMLEEIRADRFSVKHTSKEHLKSAFYKIGLEYNLPFDTSYLFNILLGEHPTLLRRLRYIDRQ